jgi:hypothetical protein
VTVEAASGVRVSLTPMQCRISALVGAERQTEALLRGLPDRHGFSGIGWDNHVEGAAGELAVAKVLGVFWGGTVNTFKAGGDVGRWQVRTRSREDYDLLIRDDDRPGDTFILVVGKMPDYCVVGWKVFQPDGWPERWRKTHGGREEAWFVPQQSLRDMEDFHT